MRMIITSILLILFHQLLTRVWYVSSQSTANDCTQNSMAVEDQGSAYSGVKMYFGDSFCQRTIQQDVTNAMKNSCKVTNTTQWPSDEYKALTTKIDTLDREVSEGYWRITFMILSRSNLTCPKPYEYYESDQFWYNFHRECKNWTDARQACQEEGGDLISLNENNFEFFRNVSKSKAGDCRHVWVGATNMSSKRKWNWLNGERVSSIFWGMSQPDNNGTNEDCGDLFSVFDYKLNDHVCSSKEHFICQIV